MAEALGGMCVCVCGGGGGGGVRGDGEKRVTWGNNGGTSLRASFSKPTISYTWPFKKNGPIHILDHLKC